VPRLRELPAAGRDAEHASSSAPATRRRPDVRRRGAGGQRGREGLPFVGQAGKLLDQLLGEIGLAREDVFVTNVLAAGRPGNRDPHPAEVDNCQDWLLRTVELVEPKVICTLGNFATKLLRRDPTGISRLHGRDEVQVLGVRVVRLLPLFHPAAALYTRSMVDTLRADFARIPDLLAAEGPEQPQIHVSLAEAPEEVVEALVDPVDEPAPEPEPDEPAAPEPVAMAQQMGLF
jgi:DNA polymerase